MSDSKKYQHVGHFFLEWMRKRNPNDICLLDAVTGDQATVKSVLIRTIRLARCLVKLGFEPGDVLALTGTNNISIRIPFYAALMVGMPVVGVDPEFKLQEVKTLLSMTKPRIVFIQRTQRPIYREAALDLGIEIRMVSVDEENLLDFIEENDENQSIEDYEPVQFDPEKTVAWLVSTSGTTGIPKLASFNHSFLPNCIIDWMSLIGLEAKPEVFRLNKKVMILSPVQWISGYNLALGVPLLGGCLVQTSQPSRGVEHIIDVINEHKPTSIVTSPSMLAQIVTSKKPCDLTCFDIVTFGGCKVYMNMLEVLKTRVRPDTLLRQMYGQTETGYLAMRGNKGTPLGSCGPVHYLYTAKLVDPDTEEEVQEPNKVGELWLKGPHFGEYYNNPEETSKSFSEDGWLKTGDLLYKDENDNYYFYERLKLLIKYRNSNIAPPELEALILTHQGVKDVVVTSVPHEIDGQHPVACVVRHPGATVTAQEIKDLVSSTLADSKHLRGGVLFIDQVPKTSTGKIARKKVEELALNSKRE